ncbi:hypothetical protein ACN28S_03875 [Cystobacter fuscus]
MSAETVWKWMALLLGAVLVATGCATVTSPLGRGASLDYSGVSVPVLAGRASGDSQHVDTSSNALTRLPRRQGGRVLGTTVARVSPAEMAVRAVASGAVQVDAFENLLALAGLDDFTIRPREARPSPLGMQPGCRLSCCGSP